MLPKTIQKLINELSKLPGIGPKTAERLAFYMLRVPEAELQKLSLAVSDLKKDLVVCQTCFNVSNSNPCEICQNKDREQGIVCVVETALDVLALEKTNLFKGTYHVLGGTLSPMENIGPEQIKIAELVQRVNSGQITETILATNPTLEGEATATYIASQLAGKTKITRIARGIPVGGDLEYADQITLQRALEGRNDYK